MGPQGSAYWRRVFYSECLNKEKHPKRNLKRKHPKRAKKVNIQRWNKKNLNGSFKTRSNNHKLSSKNNDPESELSRFSKVHATNASSIGHIKSQGKGTALYLSSGVPGVFTSWPNSKVIIERELISTNYWKSLSSGSPSPNPETILIALDHIVATQERQRITCHMDFASD